jgi:hypothetical protein
MKYLAFLFSAFILTGCGVESDAKKAVKTLLNDPGSAEFSNLTKHKDNACGLVNAKNRMGGYVGNTPFFYIGSTGMVAIASEIKESDFYSLWLALKADIGFDEKHKEISEKCRIIGMWSDSCGMRYPGNVNPMCNDILGDGSKFYDALRDKFDK